MGILIIGLLLPLAGTIVPFEQLPPSGYSRYFIAFLTKPLSTIQ